MGIAKAELSHLLNHLETVFYKEDIAFLQPRDLEPIITQYSNFVAEAY